MKNGRIGVDVQAVAGLTFGGEQAAGFVAELLEDGRLEGGPEQVTAGRFQRRQTDASESQDAVIEGAPTKFFVEG